MVLSDSHPHSKFSGKSGGCRVHPSGGRDGSIPWPATPLGMYGIGEGKFPKGKLVFCSPKKECWAYAHSRCSLHMGCQLSEERDERGGV